MTDDFNKKRDEAALSWQLNKLKPQPEAHHSYAMRDFIGGASWGREYGRNEMKEIVDGHICTLSESSTENFTLKEENAALKADIEKWMIATQSMNQAFLDEEQKNKSLRRDLLNDERVMGLVRALKLAIDAFENMWAINWADLDVAIKKFNEFKKEVES